MYIGNDLQIAHPSYKIIDDISSGFNGSATSFALQVSGATPVPFPISTQQVMISVNGVVQEPDPTGSAGFKLLGSNIVFSSAPANGHAFFGVINAGADYVTAGSEFPDGSATAPSFTFQADQDTGWFRSGSGAVGYSANGVQTLTFDGNGLTVTGDASFVGDSTKNLLWDKSDGALEFADNAKATFGAGGDLTLRHNGTDTYIDNITGGFYIRGGSNTIHIRPKNDENSIVAASDGAVEIYHDNSKKFKTTSTGVGILGSLSIESDSQKLTLGSGNDLEIYHNGSHSYIKDTGTGDLFICSDDLHIGNAANSEDMAVFKENGAVELYYDNSKKLETLSTGVYAHGKFKVGDGDKFVAGDGDDLQIYHTAGSDSHIKNITAGSNLQITSANEVQIKVNSTENAVECNANGSVDLYHDNSKKFETTSTGVNVTGAINVNGTALSAAPEVTGTASGAIATNDSVIVNSNGTFGKVVGVSSGLGSAISYYSALPESTTSCKTSNGFIVVLYKDNSGSGGATKTIIGTPSGSGASTTVTWGSATDFANTAQDSGQTVRIIALDNGRFGAVYKAGNKPTFKMGVVSGTGSGATASWGSAKQIDGSDFEHADICYVPTGRYVCSTYTLNSGHWKFSRIQIPTGTSTSYGSEEWRTINIGNPTYRSARCCHDPDASTGGVSGTGRVICVAINTGGNLKYSACQIETNSGGDGGERTIDSVTDATTASQREPYLIYDTAANKTLILYHNTSNKLKGYVTTSNGTSVTWGTKLTYSDFGLSADNTTGRVSAAFDTSTGKTRVQIGDYTDDKFVAITGAISGTTFVKEGSLDTIDNNNPDNGWGAEVASYGSSGLFGHTYPQNNSSGTDYGMLRFYQSPDSNLTASNFVGFASAGVSDGQTVTVKVTGNTHTASSLTPGTKYYISGTGALSTTAYIDATVEAGIAISSTKLLIRQ